jgi:hypothetical protein
MYSLKKDRVGLGVLILATGALINPTLGYPHGGGLEASGCHNQRSTGDYHCHRNGYTPASPTRLSIPERSNSFSAQSNANEAKPQNTSAPKPASESKPSVSHAYDRSGKVVGLSAIVNLSVPTPSCSYGLVNLTILELSFDKGSTRLTGFAGSTAQGERHNLNFPDSLYTGLSAQDIFLLPTIVREGKKLAVSYEACGAAGRVWYVRELFVR